VDAGEAEHLLVVRRWPADLGLFVVPTIKGVGADVTEQEKGGRLVGSRQAARCVKTKYWISLSCPMEGYRRLNGRVSTYHKRDEPRKATRAGGATTCATMEMTVGAGEQMARTTTVALWSHDTCFCLTVREGRTVKDLESCSSLPRRRGRVTIALDAKECC
jgi:hypothetical protein